MSDIQDRRCDPDSEKVREALLFIFQQLAHVLQPNSTPPKMLYPGPVAICFNIAQPP